MVGVLLESGTWRQDTMDSVTDMWRQGRLCDVTLLGDDGKVTAHSMVLAAGSPRLQTALLGTECRPVMIKVASARCDILKDILHFLYTGRVTVDGSNMQKLLETARSLGIKTLTNLCENYIQFREASDVIGICDEEMVYDVAATSEMSSLAASKECGRDDLRENDGGVSDHELENCDVVDDNSSNANVVCQDNLKTPAQNRVMHHTSISSNFTGEKQSKTCSERQFDIPVVSRSLRTKKCLVGTTSNEGTCTFKENKIATVNTDLVKNLESEVDNTRCDTADNTLSHQSDHCIDDDAEEERQTSRECQRQDEYFIWPKRQRVEIKFDPDDGAEEIRTVHMMKGESDYGIIGESNGKDKEENDHVINSILRTESRLEQSECDVTHNASDVIRDPSDQLTSSGLCGSLGKQTQDDQTKPTVGKKNAVHVCSYCNEKFRTYRAWLTHSKGHLEYRPYICQICGLRFKKIFQLNKHRKEVHMKLRKYGCNVCSKGFCDRRDMIEHTRIHTGERPFTCMDCGLSLRFKRNYMRHRQVCKKARLEQQEHRIQCDSCPRNFLFQRELSWHRSLCHTQLHDQKLDILKQAGINTENQKDVTQDTLTLACSFCKETFLRTDDRDSHETSAHVQLASSPRQSAATVGGLKMVYKCSVCLEAFSKQCARNKHEARHGSSQFLCEDCGKTFARKDTLQDHYMALHTNERPFTCDVCHNGFISNRALKIHSRRHTGEKPYKCKYCDQRYKNLCGLQAHERSVHTKEKPYVCMMCGYATAVKSSLNSHIITKHSEDRPYKCDLCPKAFKVRSYLAHHINLAHFHMRPYECTTCGATFGRKTNLTRHVKKLHGSVLGLPDSDFRLVDNAIHVPAEMILQSLQVISQ